MYMIILLAVIFAYFCVKAPALYWSAVILIRVYSSYRVRKARKAWDTGNYADGIYDSTLTTFLFWTMAIVGGITSLFLYC